MEPLETGQDAQKAREKLSLTQRELADMLGTSTRNLRRQESSDHLDSLVALALECLLRRRAASHQAAISPEERAERKFREQQRLRELRASAGVMALSPAERARQALDYKEARHKLGLLRGRNRARQVERPLIARLHAQIKPLALRGEWDAYRLALQLSDAAPGADSRVFLSIYTDAAREALLADDDPRITLPLEPEE